MQKRSNNKYSTHCTFKDEERKQTILNDLNGRKNKFAAIYISQSLKCHVNNGHKNINNTGQQNLIFFSQHESKRSLLD